MLKVDPPDLLLTEGLCAHRGVSVFTQGVPFTCSHACVDLEICQG